MGLIILEAKYGENETFADVTNLLRSAVGRYRCRVNGRPCHLAQGRTEG